jgi:hypothetical protein
MLGSFRAHGYIVACYEIKEFCLVERPSNKDINTPFSTQSSLKKHAAPNLGVEYTHVTKPMDERVITIIAETKHYQ